MRFKRTMIFIACASLLSACMANADAKKTKNNMKPASVQFSPIAHARTVELLHFIANYSDQTAETQKEIFLENTHALANNKMDAKLRIKQSAMLALPNSVMKDPSTANLQLQSLLDNQSLNESETNLVKLLLSYSRDNNKQVTKVNELAKKNDLLKQKNKSLAQKLNDLKNIEKTMIERNTKTNNNL